MIGKKFLKESLDVEAYTQAAEWCNTHGARIVDRGDFYEVVKPKINLEDAKAAKMEEIRNMTEAAITGGFYSGGVRYDSDRDTQSTMGNIRQSAHSDRFAENYPDGCPVRGYDKGSEVKTIHFLSPDEVDTFCDDLNLHIGTCKSHGWELQDQVKAAKTPEDLEKVVW